MFLNCVWPEIEKILGKNHNNFGEIIPQITDCGKSQKLVDQFTYLGSNISSTERDVNTCLVKIWSIWLNKMGILPSCSGVYTTVLMQNMDTNKTHREPCCLEQILEAIPYNKAAVWPPSFHFTDHPSKNEQE